MYRRRHKRMSAFQGEDETGGGVKITQIVDNAARSAKAGLKADDVVTALDGKPVGGYERCSKRLGAKRSGTRSSSRCSGVARNRKSPSPSKPGRQQVQRRRAVAAVVEAADGGGGGGGRGAGGRGAGGQAIDPNQPWPGFFARDSEDGIRVRNVTEESSAAKAGIEADDMILEVDGKKVGTFPGLLVCSRRKRSATR